MTATRTYGDSCGIARALDIIGDRWALLTVRELMLGPKRFADLHAGLGRIGPDMLTQRLRELEDAGLVARTVLPPPTRTRAYQLTARGQEIEPVLHALGRFGSTAPFPDTTPSLSVDAAAIALATLFSPDRAGPLTARYQLSLTGEPFRATVADRRFLIERGSIHQPDATITTTPAPLAAILWHGHRIDQAITAGDLQVTGSRRAVNRFMRLFPLPTT